MSAKSHPAKKPCCSPPDFTFRGNRGKTRGEEAIFAFCPSSRFESSLVWLIFPPVLQSSLVIPLQHFGCAPQKWQMCSHGNRPVMPLSPLACQMKPSSAREKNRLVTWLISCQYNSVTFDNQVAFKLRMSSHCHCSFGLFDSQPPFASFVSVYRSSYISFFPSYGLSSTKAQPISVWWQRPVEIQLP